MNVPIFRLTTPNEPGPNFEREHRFDEATVTANFICSRSHGRSTTKQQFDRNPNFHPWTTVAAQGHADGLDPSREY
jgi:hypothetical protein